MKKKRKLIKTIILIILIIVISRIIHVNISKINNYNEEVENIEEDNQKEEKYVNVLEDGSKINISEKLNQNKELDNLIIKDISLNYKNGVTTLLANVENKSDEISNKKIIEITLVDEKSEEIYSFSGIIEEVEAKETKKLNCSITADFANVYDFIIKAKETNY